MENEKPELKTLKDLKIGCKHCHGEWVDYQRVRREAIARVKNCNNVCGTLGDNGDVSFRCIACRRDIWFNNLTEEDLKK